MKETTNYEAVFGPNMFWKNGEDPHDLIVTITIRSRVTDEAVTLEFPKARYVEGTVDTTYEVDVIDDQPYSMKVWTVPIGQKVELDLNLTALPDDADDHAIYRLTRTT